MRSERGEAAHEPQGGTAGVLGERPWPQPPLEYVPAIRREAVSWPHDNSLAVIVYINVEHFRWDLPSPVGLTAPQLSRTPDVINFAWREYGLRVGIWRLMEVLDRHDVKATVALNSEVCRAYPIVVEHCLERGWAVASHGVTNSTQMYGLGDDDQRAIVRESVETIRSSTGRAPRGWLGPGLAETFETLQILWEEGFGYVADWGIADDLPYPLTVGDGGLLAMPYPQETNDLPLYLWLHRDTDQAYRQFTEQFEVLRDESAANGKVFSLALHPYLSGVPHRIRMLDRFLEHARSAQGVWWATADEVESWYRKVGLRLAPLADRTTKVPD